MHGAVLAALVLYGLVSRDAGTIAINSFARARSPAPARRIRAVSHPFGFVRRLYPVKDVIGYGLIAQDGPLLPFVNEALVDDVTGVRGSDGTTSPIGLYQDRTEDPTAFRDCGLGLSIGASSRVPATTDFLRELTL